MTNRRAAVFDRIATVLRDLGEPATVEDISTLTGLNRNRVAMSVSHHVRRAPIKILRRTEHGTYEYVSREQMTTPVRRRITVTKHRVIDRAIAELERHAGAPISSERIARAIKEDPGIVRNSLTSYVRRNPDGCVIRVHTGIFRWNADCGAAAPGGSAVHDPDLAEADEQSITATGGWLPPAATLDIPEVSIRRGGISFEEYTDDPELKFLHKSPATLDDEPSYYFTDKRGAMWRAYKV